MRPSRATIKHASSLNRSGVRCGTTDALRCPKALERQTFRRRSNAILTWSPIVFGASRPIRTNSPQIDVPPLDHGVGADACLPSVPGIRNLRTEPETDGQGASQPGPDSYRVDSRIAI